MSDCYNEQWYADVTAPDSLLYDDGPSRFRYQVIDGKAQGIYGYAGLKGDPQVVRKALGMPMFIRHALDATSGTFSRPTRFIPCQVPWLKGSPHLAESRRAGRFGVTATYHGADKDALIAFRDEYYKAMDRKDAGDKYYDIAERLELWAGNPQVHVVTAPGAGAIFLSGSPWGHYHLSYRTPQAHNTAMHAIFDCAVPVLAKAGCESIHLGGGTSASLDDPLYKFKSRIGRCGWTVFFQEVP
jgi:hypothetical protein